MPLVPESVAVSMTVLDEGVRTILGPRWSLVVLFTNQRGSTSLVALVSLFPFVVVGVSAIISFEQHKALAMPRVVFMVCD